MVRIRVMPASIVAKDVEFLADLINGVTSLLRVFSRELSYPLHAYATDSEPGKPTVIMSYTALEEGLREAYATTGFRIDETPIFEDFWPSEARVNLPSKKVVAMRSLASVDPRQITLQFIDKSIRTGEN